MQYHTSLSPTRTRLSLGTKLWSRLRAYVAEVADETVQVRVEARLEQHEAWLRARLDQILDQQNHADRHSRRSMFDTGAFAVDAPPEVPGAELVVGRFDESLPPFLAGHSGPIALLHVDSDLYSSAVTVLEHCGPRLVAGSIVVFDEYFNFPGWERHEHRAWQEYVARTGTRFTWLAYTGDDEQVVIRIDEAGSGP
ncbi:hypothetical protein F5B20DRAFT_5159 [Whalleya microplaca]|nr:hypothetical protein F5B20DRAFT_5159 [Whalleya microplaca]